MLNKDDLHGRRSKNIVTKKCILCGKDFLGYLKARYRQSSYAIRSYTSKTCSKKCSKAWTDWKNKNKMEEGKKGVINEKKMR